MASLLKALLLTLCLSLCAAGEIRRKRAIWNLGEMFRCVLGVSGLKYDGYGCWCGFGGAGEPMDPIDRCCMTHDKCYDAAIDEHKCTTLTEYIKDYSWTCDSDTFGLSIPTCNTLESQSVCGATLCHCDSTLIRCLAQYPTPESTKPCTM